MIHFQSIRWLAPVLAPVLSLAAANAQADAVTDWNQKAGELIADAKLGTPPAVRVMAVVQTAAHEAVQGAQRRQLREPAAVDAAIAAANRATLVKLLPAQEAAIATAYQAALAKIADGPARAAGVAAGEEAAAAVLAARAGDSVAVPDSFRPRAVPGGYVPTAPVAASQWPQRKPWLMSGAAQFRPAAPPALTSARWARDYNEVKALGGKDGSQRNAEQAEIARFWDYSLPAIYHGVVRSVALAPGRDVARNARLYAAVAQAMDDAMIAVFDAKYHYNFWRPVTAIRNGDADGNAATAPEATWASFIDTPMHPEYPSAHSILASSVGTLLQAEVGAAVMPELSTASPTAKGATRRWKKVEDFIQEVGDARVYDGVHYRFSTEVGTAMGRQIGELAAARHQLALVPVQVELQPKEMPRFVERVSARGVQVYECRNAGSGAAPGWVFVAPEAVLYDARGDEVGKHDAGPHWAAADGSRIVGQVQARTEAPVGGAIPWLLLQARSVGTEGRFADVTSVQRVNTLGGSAPARGCDTASVGATARVPYTADYVLFAS